MTGPTTDPAARIAGLESDLLAVVRDRDALRRELADVRRASLASHGQTTEDAVRDVVVDRDQLLDQQGLTPRPVAPSPTPARRPEVMPLWQDEPRARWMVTAASDVDPDDPDNYHRGWFEVDADADARTVEVGGVDFTVAEARLLAAAIGSAADHAERHYLHVAGALFRLVNGGRWPEIEHLPSEQQAQCRDALTRAARRMRRQHTDRSTPPG